MSRKDVKISVIIPCYNVADTLSAQLEALASQDWSEPWEIIVVDNRSNDNIVEVVEGYQPQMPNLRLVQASEKQGRSYACNVGAQMAQGEILIFCDGDDVVASGWLASLAEALSEYDVVAGSVESQTLNEMPLRPFSYDGTEPALGFLPFAIGCNMGLSRKAFEAVGGFDEDNIFSQDMEISWRLQLHGFDLQYVPAAVVHYRQRQTIRGLWKQIVSYSAFYPLLYQRFASYGMPRSSMRQIVGKYTWLIRNVRYLLSHSPQTRAKWVYEAACCWGRLVGSVRHRSLYL